MSSSSTPASHDGEDSTPKPQDQQRAPRRTEQITFQFCRECSNMLYPKEDRVTNTLMYTCRTCQWSEGAASSCVFRNVLEASVGETAGVTQDVGDDPTVGLPGLCNYCGQEILCVRCGFGLSGGVGEWNGESDTSDDDVDDDDDQIRNAGQDYNGDLEMSTAETVAQPDANGDMPLAAAGG